MFSFESALRLGLLLQPRTQNDVFDVISLVHSSLVIVLGLAILFIQVALYFVPYQWMAFLSAQPSKAMTLLFLASVAYYIYDIFAMYQQYKINNKAKTLDTITSSNTYFVGFILHHLLCMFGLVIPVYNKTQSQAYAPQQQCGPLILLCFMLGELPNIPRLIHKIIARRLEQKETSAHSGTLHSIYFVFKGCFIWCRLALIQLTWNVMQPIAPFNVLLSAWMLNIFGVIAVCWEWRMMQFKNYQSQYQQTQHLYNRKQS